MESIEYVMFSMAPFYYPINSNRLSILQWPELNNIEDIFKLCFLFLSSNEVMFGTKR